MADLAWFVSVADRRDGKKITARIKAMRDYDANGNRDLSWGHSVSLTDCQFANILVEAHTYDSWLQDDGNDWVYGSEITWDEAFTLQNAEVGIKALRKVHKYLTDAHEIAGSPANFSQWLLRIMKACKVNRVVLDMDGEPHNYNADYACTLIDQKWQSWKNAARGIVSQSA